MVNTASRARKKVGLFATCLVDLFRPEVGFATARLIRNAGFELEVPKSQTCCGQPLLNSGSHSAARKIARRFLKTFKKYDYIVAPSGSCISIVKIHYPELFKSEVKDLEQSRLLASRAYEITDFLTSVAECKIDASYDGHCTYHDSCSGLRELGIRGQPRALLRQVQGMRFSESKDSGNCCGFGGTFCVKYPEISATMAGAKAGNLIDSGADTVLGGDLGCLMNIAGTLRRGSSNLKVFHVAEVLANQGGNNPIGASGK